MIVITKYLQGSCMSSFCLSLTPAQWGLLDDAALVVVVVQDPGVRVDHGLPWLADLRGSVKVTTVSEWSIIAGAVTNRFLFWVAHPVSFLASGVCRLADQLLPYK